MPPAGVGFKRSRALWDDAKRPRDSKLEEWKRLARAIAYELQPIRWSEYSHHLHHLTPQRMASLVSTRVVPRVRGVETWLAGVLFPQLWTTLRNLSMKQWMMAGGVLVYYFLVRWIHELLDAGPLVLIVTALVSIFTVGLGEKADGEISAYSVFNKGFERLMGSVDVEALVNQHVGGGMGMMGAAGGGGGGGIIPDVQDDNQHQGAGQRRGNNNHHNHHNQDARDNDDDNDEGDGNDDGDNGDDNGNVHIGQPPPPQQQARKSGKKARRQNLDERQDQRRQREEARAMGLDGTGGQEEELAMHRLIEEEQQIAANENNQD